MLTIDKLRVGVAGISIGTLRRGNPPIDRMAQQAASQKTMQETPQNDSFAAASSFNGVSDKLDMPYAPELNPASLTLEMWVMVEGGAGYQSIVASVGGSPLEGRKGYLFCVTPSQQWQFWLGNGEPRAYWRVLTGPKVIPSEWTHLAGTYDRHSRTMTFYVNGQEVGRQIDVQYQPNDRNPMRVGAGATEQLGASPCFFCGKIAEVHIWDRVLSLTEIQALSLQQSIEIQAEPITDIAPDESASVGPRIHDMIAQPLQILDTPASDPLEQGTGTYSTLIPTPSKPSTEKPTTVPLTELPLTLKQPTTVTSMSDPQSVLWQIGRPGQAGIPAPTGGWIQVYNYTISTDPDPINRPVIPSCLVPPSASKIPNSTSQLNIHFVLTKDYTEGQLVLFYDRYGSGEDNIFLDGQLIARTPSGDKGKLKQSQIPLGVVSKGSHTLSITVSNSADSAHVIDYLQLQTSKPMLSNLTSQLLPSANQPPSRGNKHADQNPHPQGGQEAGLLGGLLTPVTGIVGQVASPVTQVVSQATGTVGQLAGQATGVLGQAGGLVGGLTSQATGLVNQATGVVGQVAGAAGNPAELLGQATGLVGGLAGQATGLVNQATGVVGQVAGAAGNPAELLGQATGLVGGLAGQATGLVNQATGVVGQVAGAAGNPAELLGQATGLVGGLAGQATGLVNQATGVVGNPATGGGNHPLGATALSVEVVAQLAGLVSQLTALIAQLSQMVNQLRTVNQSAGPGMLSPQQLAQLAYSQQVLGMTPQLPSGMAGLSPQQLAQLAYSQQVPGMTPQLPSGIAGLLQQQLVQQQLAQLAAVQQVPGMPSQGGTGISGLLQQQLVQQQLAQLAYSQQVPGMAGLSPEQLAQLARLYR